MSFDGTSASSVAYTGAMSNNDYSLGCWFRTTNTNLTERNLMRRDGGSSPSRHWLFRVNSSQKLQGQLIHGGNPSVVSTANINDGLLHFGAMTVAYNVGTNLTTLALYLDGSLAGTANASGMQTSSSEPIAFGKNRVGNPEFYIGDAGSWFFATRIFASDEIKYLHLAGLNGVL